MKPILFLLIASFTFFPPQKKEPIAIPTKLQKTIDKEGLKLNAFEILKNKCNVCHKKRNRRRVFTLENMDGYGKKIHRQVFEKKRMPKGRKIKLTEEEYDQLRNWLNSMNIK